MRILIIITKGEIGGAQNVVLSSAKKLKNAGNEVIVGFGEGEYLKEKLHSAGIYFIRFKKLKRSKNPLTGLLFAIELKKLLDKEKFDLVHFHSSNTLIGAISAKFSKFKPKTAFTFHGLSVLDENYKTGKISRLIYRLYFKALMFFIDEKIFVCNYNLEVAQKINLVSEGTVIYNEVDATELNFLPRAEARLMLAENCGQTNLEDKFLIGSIGRLAYPKNYEFLISIFPEILKIKNNAIGIIIGEGPEREKYERLIEELNLKNNFFLFGELQDARRIMRGFDLFVLPSKYEGLSITLLEAKLSGVPILASDVGGNKEILSANQLYSLDNIKSFLDKFIDSNAFKKN